MNEGALLEVTAPRWPNLASFLILYLLSISSLKCPISTVNNSHLTPTNSLRSVRLKAIDRRDKKQEQCREGTRDRVTDTSWELG